MAKRSKPRQTSFWVAAFVAVTSAFLWIWMTTMFSMKLGDFPAFYVGATLAKEGKFSTLHDDVQQAKIEAPLVVGRADTVYFVRPHVYAAVLAPLAFLPMRQAFAVWSAIQGAVLLWIVWWASRRFGNDAMVLISLFPPAILAIGFGQDAVIFLGLAVASFILYERGYLLGAGLVLGCGMIKPHLLLLFPLVLILQKRWRMLAGFALGGALEGGISLALGGIEGAKTYVAFLQKQEGHLTPNPERMINIHGMMVNLGLDNSLLRMVLVMAIIACVVIVSRRGEWWRGLAIAQLGSILVAPHVFMYDSTLLVLPALLMFFRESGLPGRIAATLFFIPLPYLIQLADKPWTIAPFLAVMGLFAALTLEGKHAEIAIPAPFATKPLQNG